MYDIYLSIYLFIYPFIYLSIYLSIYLYVYIYCMDAGSMHVHVAVGVCACKLAACCFRYSPLHSDTLYARASWCLRACGIRYSRLRYRTRATG